MIKVEMKNMQSSIELEGKGLELLVELAIVNARIITQLDMPDELIKQLFESTLHGVKAIREGKV